MECVPSARPEVLNEAAPLLNAMLPDIGVSPSRNCTEPLAVLELSVTVKVSVLPVTDRFEPAVKATDRLLAVVRSRVALFLSFW